MLVHQHSEEEKEAVLIEQLSLPPQSNNESMPPFMSSRPSLFQKVSAIHSRYGNRAVQRMLSRSDSRRSPLPATLKTGIEALSSLSMDDVTVHYDSDKPAHVGALAFAQGTDIHLAPGQEQHLPHEAWHVVQQIQGRVKPTTQAKGVSINDDVDLEREADVMGAKALWMNRSDPIAMRSKSLQQSKRTVPPFPALEGDAQLQRDPVNVFYHPVQRRTRIDYQTQPLDYDVPPAAAPGLFAGTDEVGHWTRAQLDVNDPVAGSDVGAVMGPLMADLQAKHPNTTWVRGHLLSASLGGVGLAMNLFPITQEANNVHTWLVEQKIKRALFGQMPGNYELANHGYVEYRVIANTVAAIPDTQNIDIDFDCRWRVQQPQVAPVPPGAAPIWSPWEHEIIESRAAQTDPAAAPAGWVPFVGMGGMAGGVAVPNVALHTPATIAAFFPGGLAGFQGFLVGGAAAWAPPMGWQHVLTQPAPGGLIKIVGWQR